LSWLSLEAFKANPWRRGGIAEQVRAVLSDATHGLRLDNKQFGIMQDCMHSLATSRD